MPARSIGSGTITLGLVTIPIRLYSATRPQSVSFNTLHREHEGQPCGSRVNQILVCKAHGEQPVPIERGDTVRGFEFARDQYVMFSDEELKAIEAARPSMLEILEFVPAETIDLLSIEQSYYLGPDTGGERSYALLADTLEHMDRVGVGRFAKRGKDNIVLVRGYRGGLLLHEVYFANEVCPWEEVPRPFNGELRKEERDVARMLVDALDRERFQPERYSDEWAAKVRALVEQKIAGKTIVIPPAPQAETVVDLVEALQRSIKTAEAKIAAANANGVAHKGPKKAVPRKKPADRKRRGDQR